jgi:hypothetical protein
MLRGRIDDPPIRDAWLWAESVWSHPRARPWVEVETAGEAEVFEPELYALLQAAAAAAGGQFLTLGPQPRPNRVTNLTLGGLYVETLASRAKGTPPQFIPAWMFSLAWDYLRTHGELSNRFLLATDGLNVKRSSAVCAILAKLPGVRVGEGIVLRWAGA